jgi:hypothetical protein
VVSAPSLSAGSRRIARIEPDCADPMCLAKHGGFIREMGKRCDGHPGASGRTSRAAFSRCSFPSRVKAM